MAEVETEDIELNRDGDSGAETGDANAVEKKRDKKVKKPRKKISKRRLIITLVSISACAVICGLFAGNYIVNYYLNVPSYGNYDEAALKDDASQIRYAGKKPSDLNAVQAFLVAEKLLYEREYYSASSVGTVSNPVSDQEVLSYAYKLGDEYYAEFTSTGIKNVASKFNYTSGGQVMLCSGTAKKGEPTKWNEPKATSAEEYKKLWGLYPTEIFDYIVSSKTALSYQPAVVENGKYSFEISLNTTLSVINYVNKMEQMSGLNAPIFNSIVLKFVLDEDFSILSLSVEEVYQVYYGFNVTCRGTLSQSFDYETVPERR